jgi:hypothetical protein
VRLSDKGGGRDGLKSKWLRCSFHEFTSSPLGTAKESGSPIGDCEPPHATGQEMTIAKVTDRGSPGNLGTVRETMR